MSHLLTCPAIPLYSTNGDDAVSFQLVILSLKYYTFVLVIKIILKLFSYAKHALYEFFL